MDICRDLPMLKCQHSLDDTGYTSSSFCMTNIRFERSQDTSLPCFTRLAQYCCECFDLYRITERSTSTMYLYITDLLWRNTCICQCLTYDCLLCSSIWGR